MNKAILLGALLSLAAGGVQAEGQPGETIGDFSLISQKGKTVSLSSLRKGKTTLVYFFSGCCGHCSEELRKWAPLAHRWQGRGAAVVGVQYFGNTEICKLKVDQFKLPGEVLADSDGKVCGKYGVGDFTVLVLDATGKIQYRGNIDEQNIEKYL